MALGLVKSLTVNTNNNTTQNKHIKSRFSLIFPFVENIIFKFLKFTFTFTLLNYLIFFFLIVKTILEKKKSDELMILHRVLYGDGCKKKDVKKNIREFSGVVYGENLDKAKLGARVERVTKTFSKMRDIAKMLGVEGKTTKEDLKDAIVAFLEAPADHGAVHKSVVKKAEKEEKKEAKKVVKAAKKAGKKEAKKSAKAEKPLKPLTAYMIFSNEKRPELVKKFPDLPVTEIAKKTGELWKNADKEAYKAKAEKMKEECEAASKKAGAVKKQNKKAKKAKKEEKKEVEEEETEEKEDMEEDEEKEGEDAKEK